MGVTSSTVEQLTLNQLVAGSIPSSPTGFQPFEYLNLTKFCLKSSNILCTKTPSLGFYKHRQCLLIVSVPLRGLDMWKQKKRLRELHKKDELLAAALRYPILWDRSCIISGQDARTTRNFGYFFNWKSLKNIEKR